MSVMKNTTLLLVCVVFVTCACKHITDHVRDSKLMATYRENMYDTGNSFVEYECTAEMEMYNRLSWYKIKGLKHTLMNMTQHPVMDRVNKTVILHMTLENSDQNSEVYCIKKNRINQVTHNKEIVMWIKLSFTRTIPPLGEARAYINPDADIVYFDTEEILSFVCIGTAPTDGRKLTWYFENYANSDGSNEDEIFTAPQYEIAEFQKYDSHRAVLELKFSESNHLKRLFCAQDIHVQVIEDNGDSGLVRFAQRARSKTVTLVSRGSIATYLASLESMADTVRDERMSEVPWWSTALATVLAVILFIALVVVVKKLKKAEAKFEERERFWNRSPLQIPKENHYESVYIHGAGLLRPKK